MRHIRRLFRYMFVIDRFQGKIDLLLILLFLMSVIIVPILFTSPAIIPIFDFSEYGQIGDTLGGTTAPLIGAVSAILLYYSFRVQHTANKSQIMALEIEKNERKVESAFNMIKKSIDDINDLLYKTELVYTKRGHISFSGEGVADSVMIYRGLNAINEMVLEYERRQSINYIAKDVSLKGIYLTFLHILLRINKIFIEINDNSYLTIENKKYLKEDLANLYTSFFNDFAERMMEVPFFNLEIKDQVEKIRFHIGITAQSSD